MKGYTKRELKKLDKMAKEIYGCRFEELDYEEQDQLYCMMEDAE